MQQELLLSAEDCAFQITDWDNLKPAPENAHDASLKEVLERYEFSHLVIPVPLRARYTKGRRWSNVEFEACYHAWLSGKSLTLIAASLNRNPQDIIYKLLDRCKSVGLKFTQKGRTESTSRWNPRVEACAQELFEKGLPAWKIATVFRVEFEFVEKQLFAKRVGYGHEKKNPFGINTDHKQLVNETIVNSIVKDGLKVLEAFAGEGRFTRILEDCEKVSSIIAIEKDIETFDKLRSNIRSKKVKLIHDDNFNFLDKSCEKYDLIDLDPFISCHEQLQNIWHILKPESFLFITFGGEYRRSFIKTNRKSIGSRYGFLDSDLENPEYLEIVPSYFLGFVAKLAFDNNFSFEVIRAVRYANNCRFWLKVKRNSAPYEWFAKAVTESKNGWRFENLGIPRFKEVRSEIDSAKKKGFCR